jgi:hypothetical protein
MLWHITRFEIAYRLRRVSTYVYFAIWFFMAFFSVSVRQFGPGSIGGKVFVNSPFTIADVMSTLSIFGLVVMAAIFGTSVYRDFEQDTYQTFFTTPIKKRDYLGGRFLGSLLVTLLTFSGLVFGLIIGAQMPWADQARLMPVNLWFHVQPFLLFIVVNSFVAGAIFFAVGALTRNIVAVYLQGVAMFVLYLLLFVLITISPDLINETWPALIDPLAIVSMSKLTRYWTVVEKNSLVVPLAESMLWNRLIWLGVGALALAAVFRFFPFSAEALTRRRSRRREKDQGEAWVPPPTSQAPRPAAAPTFDRRTTMAQWKSLTRLRLASILKEVPFWAIVLMALVFILVDGWFVGEFVWTPVRPVTYLMTELIVGELSLFVLIITTLYGGELVWKERTLRHDQIHDALPMPGWLNFTSQLAALAVVQATLLAVMAAAGITIQALKGYYHFELPLYARYLFLVAYPGYLQLAVVVLLVQTIMPNKFVGHALVIGYVMLGEVLGRFGFEDLLYRYGSVPAFTYSDMNGFGHFVRSIAWFLGYWTAAALVLSALAVLFARRGTDAGWRARLRLAGGRFTRPMIAMTAFGTLAFLGAGTFIYLNTHVWNDFENAKANRKQLARYERAYKQYEKLPQPKITGVELAVDIFPERRSFTARGVFTLTNETGAPIDRIHLYDPNDALKSAAFDRPSTRTHADTDLGYYIYTLAEPLAPQATTKLTFTAAHETRGFSQSEHNEFAHNGTFFDRSYFPLVGYQVSGELGDDDARRDQGLGPLPDLPPPTDPAARARNLFTSDAGWVSFKATVSTSPDQIAIAPGYLQREWTENGRRYFEYDMGDTKIANFYSFISGRYAVRRDVWGDTKIEVYYDPQHPYNVERMVQSVKAGLDYFSRNFGPYQFRQFRILEFPRYRNFAQSFPNTVPYSEGIGFIAHRVKDEDPDVAFYVTAHELAHQWWGHQIVGAFAQGSNILSETLAQYSALMVLEHDVGTANIRRYLKRELDGYLSGRSRERRKEMPLARVQREPYVWYQKGSLVMYALKDYLGEERLNAALRRYLDGVRFQSAPYTTAIEFVDALRDAAPPDLKPVVDDLFEHITLFDNRAVEARYRPIEDGKYAVTVKVSARKLRADGLGAETEIPIDDLIDIGVFAGTGQDQKALFLEKRRLTGGEATFEVVVDAVPTTAGIDPYNKLIDRQSNDNVVAVSRGGPP